MGCWNGTCAVSNLSISAGDRVVVILLVKSGSPDEAGGGYCATQAEWRPLHVPMRGEYDDYGAAELDDTEEAKVFASAFHGDIHASEKFRFYGREFDLDDFDATTPSKLLKSIERGVVQWKANVGKFDKPLNSEGFIDSDAMRFYNEKQWCHVSFMLIHESIYDALAEDVHVDRVMARIDEEVESEMAYHNRMIKTLNTEEAVKDLEKIRDFKVASIAKHHICSEGEQWLFVAPASREHLTRAFTTQMIMHTTRTLYSPQTGAGSQDDNHLAIQKIAAVAAKIVEERLARWEE